MLEKVSRTEKKDMLSVERLNGLSPQRELGTPKSPSCGSTVTASILEEAESKGVTFFDYNAHTSEFLRDGSDGGHLELGKKRLKICDSALDLVGYTPMVRLSNIAREYGLKCELLGKCEFFSAGGSTKDRIGKCMVEEAEKEGRIKPGDILIEATSGNTGVGLSLTAALKGYKMLITLPEKMSQEKMNTMKALGAEILRTPTEAAWNAPESHIGLALKLAQVLPNSHILDQYKNPANPLAHYRGTAEEILFQCDGKIDMLVASAGTGGTITGIAAKIKERVPTCEIVGVDPRGSVLAEPENLNDEGRGDSYLIEGIGYDFIPSTLTRPLVDTWVKSDDLESFRLARELIRLEGLLVGGSSGSALQGALAAAANLGPDKRVVVVLPDSCRNYMTKFMSDDWMIDNAFYDPPSESSPVWGSRTVAELRLAQPVTISEMSTCSEAVKLMDERGIDQIPVVSKESVVIGVVTEGNIASRVSSGRITMQDNVEVVMYKKVKMVDRSCKLADVSRMLDMNPFVLVCEDGKPEGVITRIDLLRLLAA